jgi:hypothetical protein
VDVFAGPEGDRGRREAVASPARVAPSPSEAGAGHGSAMDGSMLQALGLIAVAVAMLVTLYDLRLSLSPETCSECPHCLARADAERRRQEELAREYERRIGLDEDDDRKIG